MCSSSNKLKEEGNKHFMKRNYKEAVELYTKAIEKSSPTAVYLTNRALCYLKLQQWSHALDDCRQAIVLDQHSIKAPFYMGQALLELNHFDEAIVYLKRAHELSKELRENYGDEITRSIRNAKKRRWNFLEENRIKQEVELQSYLKRLMNEDKQKRIDKVLSSGNKDKEQEQLNDIEAEFQSRFDEFQRLFIENDERRRKREIPDYLCGKISFELLRDPVITPSGITYDRADIEQHLQRVGRFDPVTRQDLSMDQLIPNLSMKEVVENFISENEWIDGAL